MYMFVSFLFYTTLSCVEILRLLAVAAFVQVNYVLNVKRIFLIRS
jgi:hypothetical protein